jgi:hypothetical protein
VKGIHSDEALDQLRSSAYLKEMNHAVRIDRALLLTINEIRHWLTNVFDPGQFEAIEDLTFFVPWDLEKNMPRVAVDGSGVSLDTVWIA